MKKSWHWAASVTGAILLFLLACRLSPILARAALEGVSRPAMALLHRLTAPVPFPLAEPLALAVASVLTCALLAAALRALRSGRGRYPLRWLRGLGWTALLLGGALALLWGPALVLPGDPLPAPDETQLAWLCEDLIARLSASPLAFPDPGEALRLAPDAAGHSRGAVKAARYPEWMRASEIWGLFIPLTGEAVVDPDTPAPLLPFTAVHELMHLDGIADEGAANVAAWARCVDAGGPFADSARLWALRYALGLLREQNEALWAQTRAKMEGPLLQAFLDCGGEAASGPLRSSISRGDYAALALYLANESPGSAPGDSF